MAYINGKEILFSPTVNTSNITVDSEMSPTSENPVQNKVITEQLANINKQMVDHIYTYEAIVDELVDAYNVLDSHLYGKQDKITEAELKSDTSPFGAVPNTIYVAKELIKDLEIDFQKGMYHLIFTIDAEYDDTSKNHEIIFNYDDGELRYLGEAPDFKGGETWEISVMDGIIASGKVVSSE